MTSPGRIVPPGSTPLRELAHAIAGALTLPKDVAEREEIDYLRASRDHAPIVLTAMRRIIADHEIENDPDDLMAVAGSIREATGLLAAGDIAAADPFSAFIEAIITTLTLSPVQPISNKQYLEVARQRARRVLLACRRAVAGPRIEDADLAAATGLLDASDEAAGEPEVVP
jgi:hypothetical protein